MGSFFEFVAKNLGIGVATDRYKNLYVRGKNGLSFGRSLPTTSTNAFFRLLIPLTTSIDVSNPAPCSTNHVHRRIFFGSLFLRPRPLTCFFRLLVPLTMSTNVFVPARSLSDGAPNLPEPIRSLSNGAPNLSEPARSLSENVHRRI